MVEANEEIKGWGQPQEKPTPDADEEVSLIFALQRRTKIYR